MKRNGECNWKARVFYFNREDLAPKRYGGPLGLGLGQPLIFARSVSGSKFVAPVAIAVLVAASRR